MKTKRRTYPGSIYADRGKLYINIFGVRHSTGLTDNKTGRLRAEEFLIMLYDNRHNPNQVVSANRMLLWSLFK